MAVSVEQYIDSLTLSGLITQDELRAFLANLPPEAKPADAESLARALVRGNRLTKYQARSIYWGKGEPLHFGEYVVLEKIGEGAMGHVYKAEHRRMQRLVAIKLLPAAATRSVETRERFEREIRIAARLEHPNIVTAHDAGESDGIHYLVMQYVESRDLKSLLKERGRFSVREAIGYIIQAARGLEYAHAMGVVHRDVKPSNLLLMADGRIKILDLGLALATEDDNRTSSGRLTVQGQILGTANYMPPEQAEDTRQADARSDIYALGATTFHLIAGHPPYSGETVSHVLLAHVEEPVPSVCDAADDAPALLDAILKRMMAKRPRDRYQTMTDVILALESCLEMTGPPVKPAVAAAAVGATSSRHDATLNDSGLLHSSLSESSPGRESRNDSGAGDRPDESRTSETVVCDAAQETKSSFGLPRPRKEPRGNRGWLLVAVGAACVVLGVAALCWFLLR